MRESKVLLEAERRASGAANGRSEGRAEAIGGRLHALVKLGEAGGTGPGDSRLASLGRGCLASLQHAERLPIAGWMTSTSEAPVQLQSRQQLIIGRMRANPKPDDFIGATNP